MVTDCFIRRSRHPTQLEMYVNRTMLEAASATIRSDHLDSLARLCGEKSLGDRDIHPLDNYHLTPKGTYCSGQPLASLYLPVLSTGSR